MIWLDYVECSGGSYVNTGFTPNQDTRLDIEFTPTTIANDQIYIYGSGVSYTQSAFEAYPWNGVVEINYDGQYQNVYSVPLVVGDRYRISENKNVTTVTNLTTGTSQTLNFSYTPFTCPGPLCLGALNRSGSILPTNLRIHSCKIWDNDTLIRDMHPSKDGDVVGMYDKVNEVMYTSGSSVPLIPSEEQILDGIGSIVPTFIGLNPNPIECGESFLISASFRFVVVQDYVIPASAWKGTGPYYVDLSVQVANEKELIAYVADFATLEQRVAEYNALIQAKENGTGIIRFWAVSVKPKVDIPVKVITGMFSNTDVVNIQPGQWQGSGPWTCSLDLGHEVRTATCAMPDGLTTEQARAFIDAGLHVAGVSGNTVTLRAMLEKPGTDMRVGILSE